MTQSVAEYPRALLVHMTRVHQFDHQNLMIRNLFGDWPKDNLAQIYTGYYSGIGNFCGHYFEIGPHERQFGWLFYALKPKIINVVAGEPVKPKSKPNVFRRIFTSWTARKISGLVNLGYWDVIFSVLPSDALMQFVREFKPQIIYTQGYSLSFTHLALTIADRLGIPICYFPMDDWHSYLYSGSCIHKRVERLATKIAKHASLRFALGPKMTETLSARYGVTFECLYHVDDLSRFANLECLENSSVHSITVVYAGSLYLGRAEVFRDLLEACVQTGKPFQIDIYCPDIPPDTPKDLLNSPSVSFLPLPDHDNLPQVLAKYDTLFLPESFETKYKSAIELSLSTKAHIYMMMGKPILVYGPPWSGTVDYAKRFGWGIVVDQRSVDYLLNGLNTALCPRAQSFIMKGYETAKQNHDIHRLRDYVRRRIVEEVKLTQ